MRSIKATFATTAPNINNSLNIKSMLSPTSKKVQGFDKTVSSHLFQSKVNKLKNKPKVQGLEDQYISGLQDQIKYLQMQLKLLQQKDQQRHGQIDQLEKFFGDGIPINENILAIKNGFNSYKNTKQKKIQQLTGERQERSSLIDSLAQRVQKLLEQVNQHQKDNRKAKEITQNNYYQLIYQQALLKRTIEKEEDELKAIKQDSRKQFEKIEKVTRNKLIDNITIIKHQNSKLNKFNELQLAVTEREAELLELQKQHSVLLKEEEEKGYLIRLEEENLAQRKKVITLEREYDNLKNKIKEKAMELEEKLKERIAEIHCKMDIKVKVDALKEEINKENAITVELVSQIAREQEIQRLNRIVDANKKLAKYTDHFSNVLTHLQNSIENLAQRKPEARSQLQAYSSELVKLTQREKVQKEREITLHAQSLQLQQQFNQSKAWITPLQERTRKTNDQIQAYLQERRRLLDEIKIKQKQLQLIFVVKGLNFQEVQISKSTNSSIQQQVMNFLKSWEKIQRTG